MSSDAYQSSGGWSGGSPLTQSGGVYGGTDSVLGSYMQSMKQYDPLSGSMKTARPQQSNAQMSSLARTIQAPEGVPAAYNTQPKPATQTASAPVNVTVQTPPATASVVDPRTSYLARGFLSNAAQAAAVQPAASSTYAAAPGRGAIALMGDAVPAGGVIAKGAGTDFAQAAKPTYAQKDRVTIYKGQSGVPVTITSGFNENTGRWDVLDVSSSTAWAAQEANGPQFGPDTNAAQNYDYLLQQQRQALSEVKGDQTLGNQVNEHLNQTRADVRAAWQKQNAAIAAGQSLDTQQGWADLSAQWQAARDAKAATAAQTELDKAASIDDTAGAFNLASVLQAPDTSKVDAAGAADLARVISKYRAAGMGPEAMSLAAIGSRDAGTQATVNKTNHDAAYADAYNTNYGIFADALRARRDAGITASAQRLQLDMQGIGDVITKLTQQAQQAGSTAQTRTQAAILPLQKALQNYDLMVSRYKADSAQAKEAAQMVLSLGGSIAAALV